MVGEAGRWTDPLYSPGGDVIAIYNTLVTDSILTPDQEELDAKVPLYEELEKAVYAAYVPSFAVSYDCLGDQEAYSLKYTWELTIYFAFYVFPFINDLFTDRRFLASFLRNFGKLGRVNLSLQSFFSAYYRWKKANREPHTAPIFFDFYESGGLGVAEKTFYKVGVSIEEARAILDEQLANALMLARCTAAHIYAMVLDEPWLVWNKSFVESLDLERLALVPDQMRAEYAPHARSTERYPWPAGWNPEAAFRFNTPRRAPGPERAAVAPAPQDSEWTTTAPLIERAFTLDVAEQFNAPVRVEGTLPPYLRGTCLLNGPGRFERGGLRYRHWLDGDGMVAALAVGPGGVTFTNRFVRSEKFVREEADGRPVFRTFGTSFAGDELKRGIGLESPVNVSVYPFRGELLAFGEQGLPWALDPATLETRGLYTFDGQLNEITPFSAHPKIDPLSGELFNFGVSFSPEHPAITLFRFAPDGRLVYRRRFALPYPSSIHDFAISERYIVFYVSPYLLDMGRCVQGATLMDALSWQPERGSQLLVASRETGDLITTIPIGHRHCLHLVNAFERSGRLTVDLLEFEQPLYPEYQVVPDLFTDTFRGHPVRLVVDPAAGAIVDRRDLAYDCSPDFPAHALDATGQPYRDFWMLGISAAGRPGRKFFDQLVRVDWDTERVDVYQAPPWHYLGGEPAVMLEPGRPGSGTVICQSFDAERVTSSFVVFDAYQIARGPIATLTLASPMPLLFHSIFVDRRSPTS